MYKIDVVSPEETNLLYSKPGKDQEPNCIGHLRGDFGRGGKEFWHTWFEHQSDLKTPEFKAEFDALINYLRKLGLLKDRYSMAQYCHKHREARLRNAGYSEVYGFRVNTAKHRYYVRCFPSFGDYNFYVYCYSNNVPNS